MFLFHNLISPSTTLQSINSMDILDDQCQENNTLFDTVEKLRAQNTSLLSEVQLLRESNEKLVLKYRESEGKIVNLQHELSVKESEDLVSKSDVGRGKKEGIFEEIEGFKVKKNELKEDFSRGFEMLRLIKESLIRANVGLGVGEDELGKEIDHGCEGQKESGFEWKGMKEFFEELDFVSRMAKRVEEKLSDCGDKVDLLNVIEACKRRNDELMDGFDLVVASLARINEGLEVGDKVDDQCEGVMKEEVSSSEEDGLERLMEVQPFSMKLDLASRMVKRVECKLEEYREKVKKEKRELEMSVVSLTEENRDINGLLRVALVEKEALEKSLDKLKGDNEQKRAPLLQLAERSLQRVGFGFFMGGSGFEQQEIQDNPVSNSSVGLDTSSESEAEVVSLAFAVENLMKNLRLEISRLRIALDESRSDSERLENLTEKQVQQITELTVYIKELEDQKRILTQNVEGFLIEIKSAEEDAERWRDACELEVEAGNRVIQERDKVVAILTQELEKTRSALQVSNSKIKSKEELVVAAMAAQSAAETSLQLADSRAAELRQRIELLTRQLEEADNRDKNNESKVSRLCWPWLAFKPTTPANADRSKFRNIDVTQMLPETQTLLQTG
ncbi:uncharacterized protein At3g49055 [Silene latifolia]|uniref:uncharacterized protein At3g49055 n=1 Tax=Silene latifolia TaxID=37657 RepID=UPI003D774111